MELKKDLAKNTLYAFTAKIISLLLNILIVLFVPKLLGVKDFSYWQLYLFYVGYIKLLNLGLSDGVYLKYGGEKYENLPLNILGTQFRLSIIYQILFTFCFIFYACISVKDSSREYVIIMVAITMVINNLCLFLGYIFQAVNITKIYSLSEIIDKIFVFILIIIGIVFKFDKFNIYILFYFTGRCLALIYCVYKGRKIVFSKNIRIGKALKELYENISCGINLTIASLATTLIIGSVRFVVDIKWGIEVFGKFSLAISIESFVLVFITQISMVLYPVLRRISVEQQSLVYKKLRDVLSIGLPLVFVIYPPLAYLIKLWLPQYEDSIVYLGILLPICTFDCKMALLCNTYFKVLRKEKKLLLINIIAACISIIMAITGAYIFNSIFMMAALLVLTIAIRSYIAELYLAKIMKNNIIMDIVKESIIVIIFMLVTYYFNLITTFIIMALVYILYGIIHFKKIKSSCTVLLSFIKN